jgi:tRNA-dihydrouridine synthase B
MLTSAKVLLAPMAGVAEAPFRAICKRMGAGLTYTEMVGAKGLHYNPDGRASRVLLSLSPDETPCAVQIFGADVEMMATQARRIVERHGSDVALIDINMGCPVPKVVRKGQGCGLMRMPAHAAAIVSRVAATCGVPVTVKFRSGWNDPEVNAVEFASAMEEAGAAAVCVHGRTREQLYGGCADWGIIAAVKAAVSIPVIGSGDVFSARDALSMLARTGADAIMVARGAQGNPWIFREARALIDSGDEIAPPTPAERIGMAREHASALMEFGGARTLNRMRKHVGWYIAGLWDATSVRERVNAVLTFSELDDVLDSYLARLERRHASEAPV